MDITFTRLDGEPCTTKVSFKKEKGHYVRGYVVFPNKTQWGFPVPGFQERQHIETWMKNAVLQYGELAFN